MTEFQLTAKIDGLTATTINLKHLNPNSPLSPPPNASNEDEIEEFTKDKLEETFNGDYYKLCYYPNASLATTGMNITKYINEAKLIRIDEDKSESDNEVGKQLKYNKDVCMEEEDFGEVATKKATRAQVLGERTNLTFNNKETGTPVRNQTAYDANTMNNTQSNISLMSDTLTTSNESDSTMNGGSNETIVFSIREPFNYEIKNRLLNRGPIDELKKCENFAQLATHLPDIKVKTLLPLKNKNYSILEEIGNGAFAKIYLIENKETKTRSALKVS